MNQRSTHPPRDALNRTFYLPRLPREHYQGDAVVFWTLTVFDRAQGWLTGAFHQRFRELMLHAAAREGLLCPIYCLMPDHLHLVWMGLRLDTDQLNGMAFLRTHLGPKLAPQRFQHQAHDHVLTVAERRQHAFNVACADYVLLNPLKAELVKTPAAWPYLGAVIPGFPRVNPFAADYWPWFWKHYFGAREPGIEQRVLPPREME